MGDSRTLAFQFGSKTFLISVTISKSIVLSQWVFFHKSTSFLCGQRQHWNTFKAPILFSRNPSSTVPDSAKLIDGQRPGKGVGLSLSDGFMGWCSNFGLVLQPHSDTSMILLSHSYGHGYGWAVSSLFSRSGSSTQPQPSHQNTDWCRLRWYVHHLFRLTLRRKRLPSPGLCGLLWGKAEWEKYEKN